MPSTFLTRTNSSAVTAERKLFTISFWVKRSAVGVQHALCSAGNGGGSEEFSIRFNTSDQIDIFHYTGSYVGRLVTNRLFRDTNAWYHIYFVYDSTNSTAGDRMKLYINGVRETSFSASTNPTQNDELPWNNDQRQQIGSNSWGNSGNGSSTLNGYMSYFYNVAGSIIDVGQFGSTDSTTGEWKINTSPTIASYGGQGFLVLKDGNTITDQSPNSNNWSSGGTLTKSEDCPSNVFATLNFLDEDQATSNTFSNGNNTLVSGGNGARSTLAANSGKYYAEVKLTSGNGQMNGIQDMSKKINANTGTVLLLASGATLYVAGSSSSYGSAWSAGDIMQIAMDLTSSTKKVYFGKDGQWWNGSAFGSANPDNGTTLSDDTFYGFRSDSGVGTPTADWNFGNGYFGTTAISSEGTNASGHGKFEYNVPTGYTALCTKGLNE